MRVANIELLSYSHRLGISASNRFWTAQVASAALLELQMGLKPKAVSTLELGVGHLADVDHLGQMHLLIFSYHFVLLGVNFLDPFPATVADLTPMIFFLAGFAALRALRKLRSKESPKRARKVQREETHPTVAVWVSMKSKMVESVAYCQCMSDLCHPTLVV